MTYCLSYPLRLSDKVRHIYILKLYLFKKTVIKWQKNVLTELNKIKYFYFTGRNKLFPWTRWHCSAYLLKISPQKIQNSERPTCTLEAGFFFVFVFVFSFFFFPNKWVNFSLAKTDLDLQPYISFLGIKGGSTQQMI